MTRTIGQSAKSQNKNYKPPPANKSKKKTQIWTTEPHNHTSRWKPLCVNNDNNHKPSNSPNTTGHIEQYIYTITSTMTAMIMLTATLTTTTTKAMHSTRFSNHIFGVTAQAPISNWPIASKCLGRKAQGRCLVRCKTSPLVYAIPSLVSLLSWLFVWLPFLCVWVCVWVVS